MPRISSTFADPAESAVAGVLDASAARSRDAPLLPATGAAGDEEAPPVDEPSPEATAAVVVVVDAVVVVVDGRRTLSIDSAVPEEQFT
jgi:hypothetical protein